MSNCTALTSLLGGRVLSVAVAAGSSEWMHYTGGILNTCGASSSIDHGVTLVGAYQDDKVNYWTIKNSWGTGWGENGYIRLDRSVSNGNLCLVCSYGFYPVI